MSISTEISFVKGALTSRLSSGAKAIDQVPGEFPPTWTGCDTWFTVNCNPTFRPEDCNRKIDAPIPPWLMEKIEQYGLPPWWEKIEIKPKRGK